MKELLGILADLDDDYLEYNVCLSDYLVLDAEKPVNRRIFR